MKVCEHEFENANCANCANGLPISAYECEKTKGQLKEYVHERASEINRLKYYEGFEQGYQQGREDDIDDAIHRLENSKANCHEDYIDGIDFSIGVLQNMAEQLKEQKNE